MTKKNPDQRWRVWIAHAPDSYVHVTADGFIAAMRKAAPQFKGEHHGDVIEMIAKIDGGRAIEQLVRIGRNGALTLLGSAPRSSYDRNPATVKYPMAGDLAKKLTTDLTGNPYEVRSASGLEGVFARPEDAEAAADELRRAGASGVELKKRTRKSGRANPHDEDSEDTDILDGMARAIWVTSWGSWVEGMSREERKAEGIPSMSGRDVDDVAPETPESAYEAARDLYLLITRANGKSPGELLEVACRADGCEWNSENAELFGHYLAMQAMGEGVSWFDDHAQFPLKFPPRGFEAHYDDGAVWWSPQVRSRQNPGR